MLTKRVMKYVVVSSPVCGFPYQHLHHSPKKILVILDFFENNNNWDFLSFQNCCPMLKFEIHIYVFLPQEFTIFMFFSQQNSLLFYNQDIGDIEILRTKILGTIFTSTIRSPSRSPAASAGEPPSIFPMYWPVLKEKV